MVGCKNGHILVWSDNEILDSNEEQIHMEQSSEILQSDRSTPGEGVGVRLGEKGLCPRKSTDGHGYTPPQESLTAAGKGAHARPQCLQTPAL